MYCKNGNAIQGGAEMKTWLRVLEAVVAAGGKAWLVGDSVREVVMGIQPINLSVIIEPCDLDAFATSLGGGTVDGRGAFPVLRTSILGMKVDISTLRETCIEEELSLRDFSINAVAIRSDGVFVDPWGGRHDIRNKLVRLTGDDIELIRNDPIRIVRMLRFSAELDMDIFWKSETDVRAFIDSNPDRVRDAPAERWGREILNGIRRRPYDFIYLCDRYRLLPFFLNDLELLKNIHIENGQTLFDHTMDMVRLVQDYLAERKRRYNDVAFSLAALFHHAGSETGESADAAKASDIAARYLRAWNMSSDIVDTVTAVVRHYRLAYTPATEEQLCRAALKYGFDAVEMIMDFAVCNSQADRMKNMEVLASNKWKLGEVLRRFDETRRRTDGSDRYLTGDEVMSVLQIRPGRVVGEILNELDMAVGTGIVNSRKEATDWVLRRGTGER